MRYLLIVLIVLLLNASSALAQEEWFEVAENSGVTVKIDIKKVKIDGKVLEKTETLSSKSKFVLRDFGDSLCVAAGTRGTDLYDDQRFRESHLTDIEGNFAVDAEQGMLYSAVDPGEQTNLVRQKAVTNNNSKRAIGPVTLRTP